MTLAELAATHFDLHLSPAMAAQFERYQQELLAWNEKINLTSITAPADVQVKHFLDSLSILSLPDLPPTAHLIDVGTGAGLPGLALKIARPAWQVTLMDSTGKKVDFLNHVIQKLGLEGAAAVKMRAEAAGQDRQFRQRFDLVVARAVARLPVLLEYLLPLCKVGGQCIAMKGGTAQAEAESAALALQKLGGELLAIHPLMLPGLEQPHYLLQLRKVANTPAGYPRRVGLPAQRPIGGSPD